MQSSATAACAHQGADSEIDAHPRLHASIEGVSDLGHVRHDVGDVDEFIEGVTPSSDHIDPRRAGANGVDDLVHPDLAEHHGVGHLIQND